MLALLFSTIENERFLNRKEEVELLNELHQANIKLKEEIKAYPINEQYAEEIIEQNQTLRIERNNLIRENEQLKKTLTKTEEKKNHERYIVDDCGSIIDIETREFYDYPEDDCKVLNKQWNDICDLDEECAKYLADKIQSLEEFEQWTNVLRNKIIEQKHRIQKLEGMLTMFEFIESNKEEK